VRAVVDLYGPTNHHTRRKPDVNGHATPEPHLGNAAEVFASGAGDVSAALAESSPVSHVSAAAPPVFIAHGLADKTVNHEQSLELAAALTAADVPHELILLPDTGHTFDLDSWEGKPLTRDVRGALKSFLARMLPER
jgi:acetyl esterase/lipase